MQNGTLLEKGTQPDIVKLVEGKVFETILDSQQLNDLKVRHLVIDTSRQKDQTRARYITRNHQPEAGSAAVNATLEDAYLFLTHTKA